jgi:hypothetical protein
MGQKQNGGPFKGVRIHRKWIGATASASRAEPMPFGKAANLISEG